MLQACITCRQKCRCCTTVRPCSIYKCTPWRKRASDRCRRCTKRVYRCKPRTRLACKQLTRRACKRTRLACRLRTRRACRPRTKRACRRTRPACSTSPPPGRCARTTATARPERRRRATRNHQSVRHSCQANSRDSSMSIPPYRFGVVSE